jgi:two-component system nitrogen regulation response regulator GlnG
MRNVGEWQELPRVVESWLAAGETDLYRRALEYFDRFMIRRAVEHTHGNQKRAAEMLGVSNVTLRTKLRSLSIQVEKTLTKKGESRPTAA